MTAEHRAAVAAGVDEGVQLAVPVARDENRLPAHVHRKVIVLVRDLGLMGEINPVSLPNMLHLKLEEVGIGEDVPCDAIAPCLGIVFHKRTEASLDSDYRRNRACSSPEAFLAARGRLRSRKRWAHPHAGGEAADLLTF